MASNLASTKSVVKALAGWATLVAWSTNIADARPTTRRRSPAVAEPRPTPPPLVILATDDDAVCVDDLCLPTDDRP